MVKKQKEIILPMKFNPGLMKYEPDLPLKKSHLKVKFNWIKLLLILLILIAMGTLLIYALR